MQENQQQQEQKPQQPLTLRQMCDTFNVAPIVRSQIEWRGSQLDQFKIPYTLFQIPITLTHKENEIILKAEDQGQEVFFDITGQQIDIAFIRQHCPSLEAFETIIPINFTTNYRYLTEYQQMIPVNYYDSIRTIPSRQNNTVIGNEFWTVIDQEKGTEYVTKMLLYNPNNCANNTDLFVLMNFLPIVKEGQVIEQSLILTVYLEQFKI